jgi:hypothetical protein
MEVAMRRALVVSLSTVGSAVVLALPAAAAAAPTTKNFTEVEAGTRLSTNGNKYEDVYKVKRSPDGLGTVIRDSVLTGDTFPATGTDLAITDYADGRLQAKESFTLGVPHVDGVGTIAGTGTCIRGSLVHRLETCNYKFAGTYDLLTGLTQITLKGTETPAAGGKPGDKHKAPK